MIGFLPTQRTAKRRLLLYGKRKEVPRWQEDVLITITTVTDFAAVAKRPAPAVQVADNGDLA